MKYTNQKLGNPGICLLLCALLSALAGVASAQAFGTTTVQGTVYVANGAPGSGTLQLSWPAFTTAANQAVAAGRTTVSIASDGFVSVKLAPNVGAMPAGLFYTAVYHLSDGTTSTEYWVVPAAAQAALAQVRAQVMPAAQAVQAVNKAYVDQSIAQLVQSQITSSGGSLTGPLYLNGDPVTSPQAATKHYVDSQVGQTLSINGGAANGPLTATQLGAAYQADQFPGSDFGAKLQACISALNATYGGSCDARNFSGTLAMGSNLSIVKGNVTINLPCATIATSSQIIVTAGTRNVTLHGCASRGTSAASGSQGGTVFLYSGSAAMVQVGDATFALDTLGFHLDNVVLNTTSSAAATAQAVRVWRAQEVHLESLYLLGNANQTGITLDGTGNYTGGTFQDVEIGGYQTALNAIGHQVANAATTDWLNASTFVRLHIYCPTSNGNAIAGTTGINLVQGDGNTFTGGDVESCATALHLGPNAQNNTIVGLRNENSTYQVVADAGSAYNNWITGGTMFTGKLTDNGTRNSFLDTFHRSFNALNGDWFGSQQDSTITNHYRLGIGSGNERGLLHRYQTDSGYRWTMGLSDATAGAQYYTVLDELNNVNRLSIGQYNTGQGSSNNQTVVNAAGTGAVVLNGSNNAGSGGVVFGSGGPASTTVATINNAGNAQFNGSLQVSGASTFLNSTSIKNQADAEIDAFLWAGATAPQKESVVYKDFNGNSQWYMVKDTSNNWALNSAVGGVDSFKAYQSNNSGDTYIDAANNVGVVRVNYEPGSGSAFNVYGGSSASLYASFNGTTGIKFPGLAAGSGHNCVQIDNSGYLSNTGSSCAGSSVGAGTSGQIAYYPGNGSAISGMAAVPIASGGTGATSASAALASLGGLPASGGTLSGPLTGSTASFSGDVQAQSVTVGSDQAHDHQAASANAAVTGVSVLANGAKGDMQQQNSSGAYLTGTMSSASTTMSTGGTSFTSADAGKYISVFGATATPFATTAYVPGSPTWTPNNVARIVSVTDATHVVLDKPAVASFSGYIRYGTDNTPGFSLSEGAALSQNAFGGNIIVPAGNYMFATAPYYVLLSAYDAGDYAYASSGGTGATLSCSISGGQLTGCTVANAGGGYTPNSQLPTWFSGGCPVVGRANFAPCGNAFGYTNTNSSGQATSFTVKLGGFGYISAPTATVYAIGGDGAAATVMVSGGAISSTTITSGGGGYAASSNSYPQVIAIGGGCTTLGGLLPGMAPQVAVGNAITNAAGLVTGINWTTNATGCTSAPTVIFGSVACNTGTAASPVWGQCTNVAPLDPIPTPVSVFVSQGATFQGVSGKSNQASSLIGVWDTATVDNNQAALMGGTLAHSDVLNLTFMNAFIGLAADNNVNYGSFNNLNFGTGIGMLTYATDLNADFNNLSFTGWASWISGGAWRHRIDYPLGAGGIFDGFGVNNMVVRLNGHSALTDKIDDWYANTIWHPEFTGASIDTPGGAGCTFPQSLNQRQTSHTVGLMQTVNQFCYEGITGTGFVILDRDGRGTGGIHINNLTVKSGFRANFYGSLGGGTINGVGCEGCTHLTTDPYRAGSALEGAVIIDETGTASVNSVNYFGSGVNYCLYSVPAQGAPPSTAWNNLACLGGVSNAEVTQNPHYTNVIPFGYGLSIATQTNNPDGSGITFGGYRGGGIWGVAGKLIGTSTNMEFIGSDSSTDLLDLNLNGFTTHIATTVPSLTINGGTQATGTVGTGGQLQETTTAAHTSGNPVAFNGNGDTVNATAANVVSLFTSCSGTQYLGADGACHTASTTYTLPKATTSTLGGVKCDGTTITCGGDGTIAATSGGGGTITGVTAGYGLSGGGTTGTVTMGASLNYAQAFLASDVAMTSGNTLYDGPSVTLAAGSWLIHAEATIANTSGTLAECRIWDGTASMKQSQGFMYQPTTISAEAVVALASQTIVKISCESQGTGSTMKARTTLGSVASDATVITAVRLQ